jgi:hypothetical protein
MSTTGERALSVFHAVPDELIGGRLYPLNELEVRAREAWLRERAKYEGREELLALRVPLVNCLWNDVLHLSPVHPADIAAALAAAGLALPRRRFFEIDAGELDASRTVVFLNRRPPGPGQFDGPEWTWFEPSLVGSLSRLTESTRRYYRDCAARGKRPRPWAYLPHVLFRGSLDTRGLHVVEV